MNAAVCVYCGSRPGLDPAYRAGAQQLGAALAARGLGLVYGGARIGMMGTVADAVLKAGGQVTGVIPDLIADREIAHTELQELIRVPSMHLRKTTMAERANAFIALPGGIGTLEELFEIWTWAQLGLHRKPIALLNVAGYYDGLCQFLDRTVQSGFVDPDSRALLIVDTDVQRLLDRVVDTLPALPSRLDSAPT